MKEKFYPFEASEDYLFFWFESQSEQRKIVKMVELTKVTENIYNLAFGDVDETGVLDDLVVSNNGDMRKTLATVVQVIVTFFGAYPDKQLYFTGSSPARTRLYRAILSREAENWNEVFDITGILGGETFPFQNSIAYEGFMISRKT
ncbi:DUF6934 family protein [Dyadobacter sp. 22481]|uniref:DUF6934 family protein n=1 Tax=Dyadobacter sp. 22481 TaxID=3453926 RepID=UPI003F83DB5C